MRIKRPIIVIFSVFAVGIIVAYNNFLVIDKLIILSVAIFFILFLYRKKLIDKKVLLILIMVFILGVFRFLVEKNYYDRIDKNIEKLNNKTQNITAEIVSIGKSTNSNYFILKNVKVYSDYFGKMRCYFNGEIGKTAKIGNIVEISGKLNKQEAPMNYGQFNSQNYYRSLGETGVIFATDIQIIDKKINIVKQTIYDLRKIIIENIYKIFNKKNAGLFTAMLTGDRAGLDIRQKKLFNENGIAHIIAISGLHLSILGMMLYELLRKKLSVNVSALVVSLVVLFYAIFIDASYITLRAIIMLYIRFIALSINRSYDTKNVLFIVAFLFLMISPYLLFNAGFLFSYTAVLSLNLDLKINIKKQKIKISEIIILTLFLYPITIYNYFSYPTYSLFLNLIVIPLMTFVLLFGIIALIGSFINLFIGKFFAGIVHFILVFYENLCEFIGKLKFNKILTGKPNFTYVIFFYLVFFIFYFLILYSDSVILKIKKIKYRNLVLFIWMMFLGTFFLISFKRREGFVYSTLYVGQGDGLIIKNKNTTMTIDGGSTSNKRVGEYIIEPNLKANGIDSIDVSIITHADSDHTNGIIYLLKEVDDINIKSLILPIMAKYNDKYSELKKVAIDRAVNIIYMKQGMTMDVGDMKLMCLAPDENNEISKNDINEQSLCIKIIYDNISIMTTGDMGEQIEKTLINNDKINPYLNSNILKVGHHGSRKSSSNKFLESVSPKISIISAGINNSYKHPHKETIDRLENINTKIYNTAECGEIDVFIKNKDIEVRTYR